MTRLLLLLLAVLPSVASAQSGTIQFERAERFAYPFAPEQVAIKNLPAAHVTTMILTFDHGASLLKTAPAKSTDKDKNGTAAAMKTKISLGSTDRKDHESINFVHVDFGSGAMVESRDFMGRTFTFSDTVPQFAWNLSKESGTHLGFAVRRATTTHNNTHVEAWFTMDIPVPSGPAAFGGLPGMILSLSVDSGRVSYSATEVSMSATGAINKPLDGRMVTRAAYESVVAEKLDELKKELAAKKRLK